eukprot:351548-Chlamydomonas_euryale.AAC.1
MHSHLCHCEHACTPTAPPKTRTSDTSSVLCGFNMSLLLPRYLCIQSLCFGVDVHVDEWRSEGGGSKAGIICTSIRCTTHHPGQVGGRGRDWKSGAGDVFRGNNLCSRSQMCAVHQGVIVYLAVGQGGLGGDGLGGNG